MSDLTRQAFEQARWLDHGWVGPEHFLLALLTEASVATEALAEVGVTYDGFIERMRNQQGDPPVPRYDPEKGLTGPNPAGHQLMGCAKGFAAAWGHRSPAPEHWLLAMVYADDGLAWLLHHYGASQQVLLDALRRRGVHIPDLDPPPYRPWRGWGQHRIEVTEVELQPVLDLLTRKHPPGSAWRWGFNWLPGEPRRARVDAEEGIDLDRILAEVRGQAGS
jgi:Clp amino terminal domain, pathogenicity island component